MDSRSRRSWRTLGRVLLALVVIALIAGGVWLYQYASNMADQAIRPPRYSNPATPADYGMAAYQEIAFVTSDGLTLRGWYIPGWNGATVILGHTHKGSRVVMLPDAATLAGHGYNVFLFDWRGQGLSDGDRISFGQFEVLDMQAAVNYLIAEKGIDPAEPGTTGTSLYPASSGVDPERIGAMGESLGATVMILAAAQDPRIKAVIAVSSLTSIQDVADYQTRQVPFAGALAVQIGQQRMGIDANQVRPVDVICKISPRPVLLIHGANEDFLPPDTADKMFAAACDPKELWVVPGAGHGGFRDVVPEEFAARIVAFFDQNLLR